METPLAVANYFIKQAINEGKEITLLQVLKLVYIAHGWHLGMTGEPLISEGVEAWKYGPVVPGVYHSFKKYGNNPINSLGQAFNGYKIIIPDINDDAEKTFLNRVWETYKGFSGLELSTLTHMKGTPWYITWHEKGGSTSQGAVIANDLIKKRYLEKIASDENDQPH